ncbi:hypothetical protein MBN65_00026330 [Klebsiella pneumoniae]|nr:hypothetical protein [Klebsiella pneumoniae]
MKNHTIVLNELASIAENINEQEFNAIVDSIITANSTLAGLADLVLIIPANDSTHPMGSLFEQASLLTYDRMVMALMENLNETSHTMKTRHADIEEHRRGVYCMAISSEA